MEAALPGREGGHALAHRPDDAETLLNGEFTERSEKLVSALTEWKREASHRGPDTGPCNCPAACHKAVMLRALSRTRARLVALLLALACAWSATLSPSISETPQGLAPYPDMQLYHDVAAQVASGKGYYQAATELQRAHHFPTRPFVTVREPTLTFLAVFLGWDALRAVLVALLLITTVVWYRLLGTAASQAECIASGIAVLAGGAMITQPLLVAQHEQWAGVLLTLALALRGGRHWLLALACATTALAIRELALPFVMLAFAFAMIEQGRCKALAWALPVVAFALGMAFHAQAVNAVTYAGDTVSQGWHAMRGPGAVLQDLVDVSLLNRLPGPLAYPLALLALAGWAAVPLRQARFAILWFAGYATMLALFARAQNFYWAIVLLPAWFIGFAFVPRLLADLAHAALARDEAGL